MRVVRTAHELKVDKVADEQILAAAEHLRDNERGHGRHEHHRDARDNAGNAQREDHTAEYKVRRCAEVLRGFDQLAVELDEHGVDRQHHERQKVVHHAEHDRALRVDKRNIIQRIAEMALQERDKSDGAEKLVDKAVVLQNGHPCVGAEQEVYPHREHDEHHAQALAAGGQAAHQIRHRVAEHEAHRR